MGTTTTCRWGTKIAIIFSICTFTKAYAPNRYTVSVNKCCEINEMYVDNSCVHKNHTKEQEWRPIFTDEYRIANKDIPYRLVTGLPDCGTQQLWAIYHYTNSPDVLDLEVNGNLRHFTYRYLLENVDFSFGVPKDILYYDYEPGKYCLDKKIVGNQTKEFAWVCTPERHIDWTNTEFLMRNIINPIVHLISIACLLFIAIIYFIMPTLRDLVGNIVTTISVCLIVSQSADMIRLFTTVYNNHLSLIIAETVCYVSLLGGFFWLNSLGYYIWKTFKSRNVYLRITDGKKYCYYSGYAWANTIIMGCLAVFAHYTMDYPAMKKRLSDLEQEQIGSLAMIIFFMPIAFTVLVNIFFLATTMKLINRMNTYGRIHHKLKHSFRMFVLLFIVMTLTWIFFLMSFSKYDGLIYCYIIISAVQAPVIMYICVFNQKHVGYLIKKTCCYVNCICPCWRPDPELEWGDEMTAMNTGIY